MGRSRATAACWPCRVRVLTVVYGPLTVALAGLALRVCRFLDIKGVLRGARRQDSRYGDDRFDLIDASLAGHDSDTSL